MEVPIICIHPFKWVATTGQQFLIAKQISFMTFDNMYSTLEFFSKWFNNDLLTVHWRASCLGLSDAWVQSSSSWRTSFWKQCSKHKYTYRKWSHRILPATNKNKINTLNENNNYLIFTYRKLSLKRRPSYRSIYFTVTKFRVFHLKKNFLAMESRN